MLSTFTTDGRGAINADVVQSRRMQQGVLVLLTLGLLIHAVTALAQSRAAPLTAADVEVFFDGLIPAELERADIAGATVAVVKDGALLFAKGYGLADVETSTPVRADVTLFRPGSISKL